jgi:hypothetical protein
MDWLALLSDIFEVCVLPLLGVLTMYLVKFIQVKSTEITNKVDNDLIDKYVAMLAITIENCVIATNQTYVESLKQAGKFDAEAQKTAFNMTKNAVMTILSDEAKKYLENAVGDLNEYITQQIEATVKVNKSDK